MTDAEASVPMLKTELSSPAAQQEAETVTNLQGKCLVRVFTVMPFKLVCYLLILVLTVVVVGLLVALLVRKPGQVIVRAASCPKNWIGFGSKCFYFSEDMRSWTYSNASCVELEAQLAQFDSLEELKFLWRYAGSSDHWIGLRRESSGQPWNWTDSTEYNNLVPIRGEGECAYLNDNGISSSRDYTERKWICSKSNSYAIQCPIELGSG